MFSSYVLAIYVVCKNMKVIVCAVFFFFFGILFSPGDDSVPDELSDSKRLLLNSLLASHKSLNLTGLPGGMIREGRFRLSVGCMRKGNRP